MTSNFDASTSLLDVVADDVDPHPGSAQSQTDRQKGELRRCRPLPTVRIMTPPHLTMLAELRSMHAHIESLCSPDEYRSLGHRVDRFSETPPPDTLLAYRELLRRGISTLRDMRRAVQRRQGLL